MTWYALKAEDSEGNRDIHREHAARLPFLLEQGLGESDWPDRRCWSIRRADDLSREFTEVELLTLALRTDRILITRNPAFLDDLQFSPAACPGLIVVGDQWLPRLDEFLVTIATLLGPFRALYHAVKIHAGPGGTVEISGPAGGKRRVVRRFVLDADGMPLLTEIQNRDGQIYGFPGYRRSATRVRQSAEQEERVTTSGSHTRGTCAQT